MSTVKINPIKANFDLFCKSLMRKVRRAEFRNQSSRWILSGMGCNHLDSETAILVARGLCISDETQVPMAETDLIWFRVEKLDDGLIEGEAHCLGSPPSLVAYFDVLISSIAERWPGAIAATAGQAGSALPAIWPHPLRERREEVRKLKLSGKYRDFDIARELKTSLDVVKQDLKLLRKKKLMPNPH